MRKTLLLLVMALFMPVLAMAQTENKAVQKTMPTSYYNNIDTRVTIPYTASGYTFGTNGMSGDETYTIGLWYNASAIITNDTSYGMIMSFGTENHMNTNGNWWIGLTSNGKLTMYGGNADGNNNGVSAGISGSSLGTCPLDSWHYVTLVVDNQNLKLAFYIDGENTLEKALTNPLRYPFSDGSFQFGSYGVTMAIDEVHLFNSALTADEVQKAYYNPSSVASLQGYYTFDETAAGTTNYFDNQCSANNIQARFQQYKGTAYWVGGLVDNGSHTITDIAATLVDGREIVPFEVNITAIPAEGGTYTISDGTQTWTIDDNFGDPITVNTGTELTFTATPNDGYELIGFFTMNGDTPELIDGGKFTPVADAMVSAQFTNQHCALTITNAQEIPYTITFNGAEVTDLSSLMVGAPYQLTLNVPDTKVLNDVTLTGGSIEAKNGGYEFFFDNEGVAQLVIDAREKYQYTITINQPENATVAVSYGSGTAATTVNSGDKVIEGTTLNITATSEAGYKVTNITVGDESFAGKTYSFTPTADVTISAIVEEGVEYPAMVRYFTNGINQQNRYVKKVTTTGTETPTVFNATTKEELPYTYFEAPNTTKREEGAIIDKTANPIIVDTDVRSFTMTFEAWTDAIDSYTTELGWSCQAAFIDWNRDGNFSGTDEIYEDDGSAHSNTHFVSTPYTRTITIPENVGPGTYRLRVVYNEPEGGHNDNNKWYNTYFNGTAPIELRNGVAYDFDIVVTSTLLDAPRTVTVVSANETLGTVAITDPATEETSVTTDQKYVTVKATAAENAVFMNWTNENDQVVSSAATYKFDGEADATLTANFGHSVTISDVQYGSLAVTAGEAAVTSGDVFVPGTEITVTATPAGGKELKQITINGTPVETTDNAYTFTLNTNTVIAAEFQDVQYQLSVVTEGNGTVTVSSDVDDLSAPAGDIYTDGSNIPYGGELYINMVPGEKGDEHETINSVIVTNGEYTIQLSTTDGEQTWAPDYNTYALLTDVSTALYYGGHDELTGIQGNVAVTVAFSNELSAISDIIFDAENGPVEYYNLQGVRVAAENLTPGFYIARQGSKATKILIRK